MQQLEYADLFTNMRQFTGKENLRGWDHSKAEMIRSLGWLIDPMMAPGRMRFLDMNTFLLVRSEDGWFDYEDFGTGNLFNFKGDQVDYDNLQMTCRVYSQLLCLDPGMNTDLRDLSETAVDQM
jgi:hypothetical protein